MRPIRLSRPIRLRWLALTALSLLSVGGTHARAEDRITVGAYINDIQNLDMRSHSYGVDLYVWFRWKNPELDPAATFEFINPFELWGHSKTTSYSKPEKLPTGELYQVLRVNGRFSHKFNLANYPFDKQVLDVKIEDNVLESARASYVADTDPISANPKLMLPGFTIGRPRLEIEPITYPTRFGDPREKSNNATFSRIRIELPIQRPPVTYVIKLMLPILCVVFCAALMLLFNPSYTDARVGIGITALLTIVALQITLNEDLPEIDYLVLIDKIYLGAYLYVIGGLAVIVKNTWQLEKKGDMAEAIRLDRVSLAILTAGYLLGVATLIGLSLR
jgi:hypothetical protein